MGNTPAEAVKWALSGFSNDTVWLAISVISLMLLTKMITWDDIAANKQAWAFWCGSQPWSQWRMR